MNCMMRALHHPPYLQICRGIRQKISSRTAKPRRGSSEVEQVMVLPLVEEQLKSVNTSNVQELRISGNAQQKAPPRKQLRDIPLSEPVTRESQYEQLASVVTPLCKKPYYKQLKMKEHMMRTTLHSLSKRLAQVHSPIEKTLNGLPCPLEPTRPSPALIAYRNKNEFSVYCGVDGNPKTVGYFIGKASDPLRRCVPPLYLINISKNHKDVAQSFQNYIRQSAYNACHKFNDGGIWRNLLVRSTEAGELMATVIIHPQNLSEEEIQDIMEDLRRFFFVGEGSECGLDSLYLQACKHTCCTREQAPYRLIAGQEHITETCNGLSFRISPDAFFQVNTKGAEVLYNTVKEIAEVSPITTVLDVCCGTGTISLVLASHVRGTVGIDVVTGAIEDAKQNAAQNNLSNTFFIAHKAEQVLPRLTDELRGSSEVTAIVNPARAGLHPTVIEAIRQCESINKLIYISCKPEGYAMENFVKLGFTRSSTVKKTRSPPFVPKYAVPVDLFPHTDHTELVLLFERVGT